jgi:transposase-like protein
MLPASKMHNFPQISESLDELETLVREERDAQVQRRFHMLLLLASGEAESRAAVARQLKVHRNTVSDWLDLYEEGGLDGLRAFGTPGPEPGQQPGFRPARCRRSKRASPLAGSKASQATKRSDGGLRRSTEWT